MWWFVPIIQAWEAEAEQSQAQGRARQLSENLSQNKKGRGCSSVI